VIIFSGRLGVPPPGSRATAASAESRPPEPARCAFLLGIRSSAGGGSAKTWGGLIATVFPEFTARDSQERADGGRRGSRRRVDTARSAARTPDLTGLPWRPAT